MNSPYHQGASTYHIMPSRGRGVSPPIAKIVLVLYLFLMRKRRLPDLAYKSASY